MSTRTRRILQRSAETAFLIGSGMLIGFAFVLVLLVGHEAEKNRATYQPYTPRVHSTQLPRITEDDPRWNCATMGDHQCGSQVTPNAPDHCVPVEFTPGITTWLEMRANGPAYCTEIQ